MLSYQRAADTFAKVNWAGRLNHDWCTRSGWQQTLESDFARHGDRYLRRAQLPVHRVGPSPSETQPVLQAAFERADRLVLSHKFFCANVPRTYRAINAVFWQSLDWIEPALLVAGMSRTSASLGVANHLLVLWPVLEIIAGRGHLTQLAPEDIHVRLQGEDQAAWECFLSLGLLGLLLERPGIDLSQRFRNSHGSLAAVSLYGACLGRVLVLPLRLAATVACLVATLPVAVVMAFLVACADGALDVAKLAMRAVPQGLRQAHALRTVVEVIDEKRVFWAIYHAVHIGHVMEDTLQANDLRFPPKGDIGTQVRKFVVQEMKAFQALDHLEGQQEAESVMVLRDSIVARLAERCSALPDNKGFEWGVAHLNAFIAIQYDESLCYCSNSNRAA